MWQKYQGQDFLLIGIHDDEPPDLLANFLDQTGITFDAVADTQTTRNRFVWPPGVQAPYPRQVIVDKNLVIRSLKASYNVQEVDALIQQLLAAP